MEQGVSLSAASRGRDNLLSFDRCVLFRDDDHIMSASEKCGLLTCVGVKEVEGQTCGAGTQRNKLSVMLFGRKPVWTVLRVLLLIGISLLTFKFILVPVKVKGNSMEPTCYDGQIGVVNMLAYMGHQPRRRDIVVIRSEDKGLLVKRIIGLPGERIAFHRGVVLINGQRIAEPYLSDQGAWEWPEQTLGSTVFFVTGDNRVISQQLSIEGSRILGEFHSWHP